MPGNTESNSVLKFKKIDIYFIYSFFIKMRGSLYDLCEDLNDFRKDKNDQNTYWKKGKPSFRKGGVTTNLKVTKKWLEKHYREFPRKIVSLDKEEYFDSIYNIKNSFSVSFPQDPQNTDSRKYSNVGCEILTRIFDTGIGTVTIKLSLEGGGYDSLDIHNLFNLVDTGINNGRIIHEIIPEKKIFNLFKDEIEYIHGILNKIKYDENNDEYCKWLDEEYINVHEKIKVNKEPEEYKEIEWQNPYVITVGTLNGKPNSDKDYWWNCSDEESKKKCSEAATLLFRFLKGHYFINNGLQKQIRIPPELQGDDALLKNYAWYNNIFIGFHPRSSLVVKHDTEESKIAGIIVKSLLDLMEILRSRWHISIGINALLDSDIEILRNHPNAENLVFLKKLISRRKQFAMFLNDPIPYTFEGGIIGNIEDVACKAFYLDELREMTLKKFDVIDKMYEDQINLIRIEEVGDVRSKMQIFEEQLKKHK